MNPHQVKIDAIEVMSRAIKHGLIENDEDTDYSVKLVQFGQQMFELGVTRTVAAWFGAREDLMTFGSGVVDIPDENEEDESSDDR